MSLTYLNLSAGRQQSGHTALWPQTCLLVFLFLSIHTFSQVELAAICPHDKPGEAHQDDVPNLSHFAAQFRLFHFEFKTIFVCIM